MDLLRITSKHKRISTMPSNLKKIPSKSNPLFRKSLSPRNLTPLRQFLDYKMSPKLNKEQLEKFKSMSSLAIERLRRIELNKKRARLKSIVRSIPMHTIYSKESKKSRTEKLKEIRNQSRKIFDDLKIKGKIGKRGFFETKEDKRKFYFKIEKKRNKSQKKNDKKMGTLLKALQVKRIDDRKDKKIFMNTFLVKVKNSNMKKKKRKGNIKPWRTNKFMSFNSPVPYERKNFKNDNVIEKLEKREKKFKNFIGKKNENLFSKTISMNSRRDVLLGMEKIGHKSYRVKKLARSLDISRENKEQRRTFFLKKNRLMLEEIGKEVKKSDILAQVYL